MRGRRGGGIGMGRKEEGAGEEWSKGGGEV